MTKQGNGKSPIDIGLSQINSHLRGMSQPCLITGIHLPFFFEMIGITNAKCWSWVPAQSHGKNERVCWLVTGFSKPPYNII